MNEPDRLLSGVRTAGVFRLRRRPLRIPAARTALIAASLLLSCAPPASARQAGPPPRRADAPPDRILLNGTVHTLDAGNPRATAVAIRGNRIVLAGGDSAVRALAGEGTEIIDLAGRAVIPGFIESHGHLIGLGYLRQRLELAGTRNFGEIVAMVADAARRAKPGEWIQGRGWHQSKWDRPPSAEVRGFPTHEELTAAAPENPVWLRHASGHAGIANARAMQLAGVGPGTPSPEGGEIIRDSLGRATGVFVELAQTVIADVVPAPSIASDRGAVLSAVAECVSKGITTFVDAGADREQIALYRQLADSGLLDLRIAAMVGGRDRVDREALFAAPPDTGRPGGFLTARALKLSIDGALGSRSAWLLEPYADEPGTHGHETLSGEELASIASEALARGYQVCVHAIGDRANRETLDAFERAFAADPAAGAAARFRVEHAQILDEREIPRFAKLGVIASMQGIHCPSDRPWAPARLGDERIAEGGYVWRKLLEAGAVIVNGTDAPVEDVDPIRSFHASVTRQLPDGTPPGGFDPGQKMTREEALRSYTLDAAYGIFAEGERGSLAPGKLADLVILSRDILEAPDDLLLSTAVEATMVDGRFVYRRGE